MLSGKGKEMIIVEIQAYGDDAPYTHAIVKSDNHTKDSLKGLMEKYSELMHLKPHQAMDVDCPLVPKLEITSSGISGISNFHKCNPDDLLQFFVKEGFSFVKTSKIILSD